MKCKILLIIRLTKFKCLVKFCWLCSTTTQSFAGTFNKFLFVFTSLYFLFNLNFTQILHHHNINNSNSKFDIPFHSTLTARDVDSSGKNENELDNGDDMISFPYHISAKYDQF